MFLQLIKITQKKELTEYFLQDNNPISNFLTKGKKDFGFAITAIPNHFYKQVEETLKKHGIDIPPIVFEFSVKKTKKGFDYKISF